MKNLKVILFVFALFLFSCEDLINCVIPRSPELSDKEFPVGSTQSYYYTEVRAEIKNEPFDNDYDYFFEIENDLPLGLDFYVNNRTLSIEGDPIIPGTYTVKILLFVEGPFRDGFDGDNAQLCEDTTSKVYTLIIE